MKEISPLPICNICNKRLTKHRSSKLEYMYICDHCKYFIFISSTICKHCSSIVYVQPQREFKSGIDTKYISVCSNTECPDTSVTKLDNNSYIIRKNLDYVNDVLDLTYINTNGDILMTIMNPTVSIILPKDSAVSNLIVEIINARN